MPEANRPRRGGPKPEFLPTEEEIAAACKAIRAGWGKATLASRRQFPAAVPWYCPELEVVVERELPVA